MLKQILLKFLELHVCTLAGYDLIRVQKNGYDLIRVQKKIRAATIALQNRAKT
jgi:hypothetical protein